MKISVTEFLGVESISTTPLSISLVETGDGLNMGHTIVIQMHLLSLSLWQDSFKFHEIHRVEEQKSKNMKSEEMKGKKCRER